MSPSGSDSAAVDANKMQSSTSTTDSVAATTTNPDSIKIKMDSVTAPATK